MTQRVLVLGGGSAGFLAALTLKIRLPQLQVTVLRSKDIGIIGVGEGTTALVPKRAALTASSSACRHRSSAGGASSKWFRRRSSVRGANPHRSS